MTRVLSLTQRYLLLVTLIIVSLVTASVFITTIVLQDGMVSLLRQNIEHSRSVVTQYEASRAVMRARELDVVIRSPRFIAAMETEDSATITEEAPGYLHMLSADGLILLNSSGKAAFAYGFSQTAFAAAVSRVHLGNRHEQSLYYISDSNTCHELVMGQVSSSSGLPLGWIVVSKKYASETAAELKRLTGLDIVISNDLVVLGSSQSALATALINSDSLFRGTIAIANDQQIQLNGEHAIVSSFQSPASGTTITFIGSLDKHAGPIQSAMTWYLLILAVIGGTTTLSIIYIITDRHIGRQISHLVAAAERIASGDLESPIHSRSRDELGYLAGEMENMRSRIVADRRAIESAHQERLATAKMAALGQMAAGIIHDFKNPIAIVSGTIELIKRNVSDVTKLDRYCSAIETQMDRMLALAQDILEYSRGRTKMELAETNLFEYFETVRQFHAASFASAGIDLLCLGSNSMSIKLDSIRFRRVVDNILNNAREALMPGQMVRIRWDVTETHGEILIEDNGPGIPPSIRETIFDPFVTNGKEHGTGLGLAIARKIVEDHGGSIAVTSEEGVGTSFCVMFPASLVSQTRQCKSTVEERV